MRLRQPLQSGNPMFYLGGVPRSVVQREGMEMSDEGIRAKRKHAILVLGFNWPSAAETISWTCAAPMILKSELWNALMAAAFTKMCSRLVFVLRMKRKHCPQRYKP